MTLVFRKRMRGHTPGMIKRRVDLQLLTKKQVHKTPKNRRNEKQRRIRKRRSWSPNACTYYFKKIKSKKSGQGHWNQKILTVGYKCKININKVPEKRWGSLSAGKQNKVLAVIEAELWLQFEGPFCPAHALNTATTKQNTCTWVPYSYSNRNTSLLL